MLFHTISNFWPSLRLAIAFSNVRSDCFLARVKHGGGHDLGSHMVVLHGPHDYSANIYWQGYVTILADHDRPILQRLFPMVMLFSISDCLGCPLFGLSRSGFVSLRVICRIFPGRHSRQISILSSFYGLSWRERCVIAIHFHHCYKNFPLCCRKNFIIFPWKQYRTYI